MHDNRKFENVRIHVQRMVKLDAMICIAICSSSHWKKEKKITFEVRKAFYLFYIIFSREMLTIKSLPARWNEYLYKRTKVVKVEYI